MVLEGIAALSLASNITQLVEFGIRIGELTQHFRDNCGELPKDLQRVVILVNDIVPITRRLQAASTSSSNPLLQEQSLIPLVAGCEREAHDLRLLLESLKTARQSGWQSFILALKTNRKAGRIRKIEKALEKYKTSMALRLAEASLAKQYVFLLTVLSILSSCREYICEVLDRNKDIQSSEASSSLETLERLDASISTSFHHLLH